MRRFLVKPYKFYRVTPDDVGLPKDMHYVGLVYVPLLLHQYNEARFEDAEVQLWHCLVPEWAESFGFDWHVEGEGRSHLAVTFPSTMPLEEQDRICENLQALIDAYLTHYESRASAADEPNAFRTWLEVRALEHERQAQSLREIAATLSK